MKTLRYVPDADGRGGRIPPSRAGQVALACAVLWNLGLPQVVQKSSVVLTAVGLIAAFVFGIFFVRSFFRSTRLRFEDGEFLCTSVMPTERFEHLVADIERFACAPSGVAGYDTHRLWIVTRSGAQIELPCNFDGLVLTAKGSRHAVSGLADAAALQRLADTFNATLEDVRRESTQYRIADVAPAREEEQEEDQGRRARR